MKVGDKIVCVDAKGLGKYGLRRGEEYTANSVSDFTELGDHIYVSVFVNGRVVYTKADRFEVVEEDDVSNP